jgi:hypothetical protein
MAEAVHVGGRAAEHGRLLVRAERGEQVLGGPYDRGVRRGQGADRPVASEQDPIRSEADQHVLGVGAQVVDRPRRPRSLRLYGAFAGAVIYMILEDQLAKLSPEFWEFGVGLVLVLTVLFARRGLLGLLEDITARLFGSSKA